MKKFFALACDANINNSQTGSDNKNLSAGSMTYARCTIDAIEARTFSGVRVLGKTIYSGARIVQAMYNMSGTVTDVKIGASISGQTAVIPDFNTGPFLLNNGVVTARSQQFESGALYNAPPFRPLNTAALRMQPSLRS